MRKSLCRLFKSWACWWEAPWALKSVRDEGTHTKQPPASSWLVAPAQSQGLSVLPGDRLSLCVCLSIYRCLKSLHKEASSYDSYHLLDLFRLTYTCFFVFLLSRLFLDRSKKWYSFICVVFRPDPIYKYFGGRQRHLLMRSPGGSTLKKMTGVSPSVNIYRFCYRFL